MKKLVLIFVCMLSLAGSLYSRAKVPQSQDDAAKRDSTVDVIGWFEKNDTLDYWIQESEWKVNGKDTIKSAAVSSKVRIVVTDSTSKGYKMDYTFLDFRGDSLVESAMGKLQNHIVEKFGKKIIGTTVHFETDEYGEITKFTNLSQIKKQAKGLFKDAMTEIFALDEIKNQKGVNIKSMLKDVDVDELVDGYLEELKLLFMYHGKSFNVGEFKEHEDSTATSYENDTYNEVYKNPENGTYAIETIVVNIIPKDNVRAFLGGIAEQYTDKSTEEINKTLNEVFDEDATLEDYLGIKYMGYGMPYDLLKQKTISMKGAGKVEQTYIYLDYISE